MPFHQLKGVERGSSLGPSILEDQPIHIFTTVDATLSEHGAPCVVRTGHV